MRRAKALWIIGFLCACFLLTAGCKAKDDGIYYELEDFESIVMGQSTLRDVYELVPFDEAWPSAQGLLLRYPTEDGKWIVVKFYNIPNGGGELDFVVRAIEIWDDF